MPHALIQNGVVVQLDLTGKPPDGYIEVPNNVQPGFTLDGETWIAPPTPDPEQLPVALCQIAGARLVVDQEAWDVTGVERSTGIAGAWLEDDDTVVVLLTEPQPNTFYEVVPSQGVTKFNDYLMVERPGMTSLSFIVQRVQ